jgi:long-chain acyl-CoA synthetase
MNTVPTTFVDVFRNRVSESPRAVALRTKQGQSWIDVSWEQWDEHSQAVAGGLLSLGMKSGEKACIQSNSRYEWVVADIGILMACGVTVPIYHSNTTQQCGYIIVDSGARFIFVEDPAQLQKLIGIRDKLPRVEKVIYFSDVAKGENGALLHLDDVLGADHRDWVLSMDDLAALGRKFNNAGNVMQENLTHLTGDDICTIVYTSGTTGPPKGVVLTHANFAFECDAVLELGIVASDTQLLFLPLAHIFAKVLYAAFIRIGAVTAFAESILKAVDNMKEIHPTIVGSVPRVFEKVHTKVVSGAQQAGGLKLKIFEWARGVGAEVCDAHENGRAVDGFLKLKHALAMKLVGRKLHDAFGGNIRFFVSGGAPLSPELSRFFFGFGLQILEGYGLTETTAATHANRLGKLRFGTVGQALSGVEVQIADDGEILVKGPNIMRGYYQRDEATNEVLRPDGWFHTGDIGELDEDAYLTITDRKKDIIVTAGGKNIAPQNIENSIKCNQFISQVMIYGDKRKFLSALVTLDEDTVRAWAEQQGIEYEDFGQLTRNQTVYELIDNVIQEKNSELPSFETIKKFVILESDFSQEDGELTPTLKVRRKFVTEKYQSLLDSFYTEQY